MNWRNTSETSLEKNHGFVELVVIVFTLNTRYDYVILYFTYTATM